MEMSVQIRPVAQLLGSSNVLLRYTRKGEVGMAKQLLEPGVLPMESESFSEQGTVIELEMTPEQIQERKAQKVNQLIQKWHVAVDRERQLREDISKALRGADLRHVDSQGYGIKVLMHPTRDGCHPCPSFDNCVRCCGCEKESVFHLAGPVCMASRKGARNGTCYTQRTDSLSNSRE